MLARGIKMVACNMFQILVPGLLAAEVPEASFTGTLHELRGVAALVACVFLHGLEFIIETWHAILGLLGDVCGARRDMHTTGMLGKQILALERSAIGDMLAFMQLFLLACAVSAKPEARVEMLRCNMALPFILTGESVIAAGKLEDADEGALVILPRMLLKSWSITEDGAGALSTRILTTRRWG